MKKAQFTKFLKKIAQKNDHVIFLKMKKLLKITHYVDMLKLSNYNKKIKSVFANTLKIYKIVHLVYRVSKVLYLAVKAFEYICTMLM